MGRPTKLTPAIQQAIVTAVSGGVSLRTAAHLAGVHEASLYLWMQRGEGTHPFLPCREPYIGFYEAITRARAQDETRRVLEITRAGQGGAILSEKTVEKLNAAGELVSRTIEVVRAQPDWRAHAFYLERSRPEEWGRRDRVDVHVVQRAAAQVAEELGMTAEEVLAEAQAFLKEQGQRHGHADA